LTFCSWCLPPLWSYRNNETYYFCLFTQIKGGGLFPAPRHTVIIVITAKFIRLPIKKCSVQIILQSLFCNVCSKVYYAVRVSSFIVIPRKNFYHVAFHYHSR